MRELTLEHVEQLAHRLARQVMSWDEPIPDFTTRFPGKLESSLKAPLQTYGGKDLYPLLVDKAAILFYLMIKNHPFQNGNKRIAVTSLFVFLDLNNRWLSMHPDTLYQVAMFVAQSPAEMKEAAVQGIKQIIAKYLVVKGKRLPD